MILATSLALALAFANFSIHFFALRWLAKLPARFHWPMESHVLVFVVILFTLHIFEIALYAGLYGVSSTLLDLGKFSGETPVNAMEYMYYSGVIFTSLGLGDIYPLGHLRFITAVETLNGFLLITWSASFTFLAMSGVWNCNPACASGGEAHARSTVERAP